MALQARIGGLPPVGFLREDTIEETIQKVNASLQSINIEPDHIESIVKGKNDHCTLIFKTKEDRILRQSHLLKGKNLWIAEELTSNQLKNKVFELKKMREARQQGKWAVLRGGKAIIQEFHTPKPAPPPPPPTSP